MSDRDYDVITFGDMCVDLIVSGGDVVPRFGQVEQLVGDYELEMGGSCCLFACQAAKLGLRVGILGRVGDDAFGRLIVRRLNECGVDTAHVLVDGGLKTGLGIALCRVGDRAILTYLGSICALTAADVSDAFLRSARHVHHGSFYLHSGLRPQIVEILKRARAFGASVSLDPNWDPEERWRPTLVDALPLVDVFLPNAQEAQQISGCEALDEAAAWLRERGAAMVAIKRGAEGATAYAGGRAIHRTVLPPMGAIGGDSVGVGDSIGAGDSFDAGFLAGWLRGMPLDRCLQIGCACGRSVAGAVGGLAGQLTWEKILKEDEGER